MTPCVCSHDVASHVGYKPGGAGDSGCLVDKCSCKNYVSAGEKTDILTPEREKFARALIGQQQQIILKSRRIIEDVKREFGLKE